MDALFDLGICTTANQLPKAIVFNPRAVWGTEFTVCIIVFLVPENILGFSFHKNFIGGGWIALDLVWRFLVLNHRLSECISVLSQCLFFVNSHMTILSVEIIECLAVNIEQRLLNLQIGLHNWHLIYLSNHLLFRRLWKSLIYQTFLGGPIHEASSFEGILLVEAELVCGLADIPGLLQLTGSIWISLILLFHDVGATLGIFV